MSHPGVFARKLMAAALLCCVALAPDSRSQAPEPAAPDEVTRLRLENQQLREENQRLRQLLTPRAPATAATPMPAAPGRPPLKLAPMSAATAATPAPASESKSTSHWLTLSSNKRHNSGCRYYKTGNGKPCGASDGVACKVCGG